jgi:phospholipid/cholesterol/gamma-HCH transport system substrate-binding protein
MMTLSYTNKNLSAITENLMDFTARINEQNTFWRLLSDSTVADDVKSAVSNLRATSAQSMNIMNDLKKISYEIKSGKGMAATLLNDTTFVNQLESTISKLESFGDSLTVVSSNISEIVTDIQSGKGTAGQLLKDTTLIHQLNKSLQEIEQGAKKFDENMEALKTSWPFKKYYKKKKKQENK